MTDLVTEEAIKAAEVVLKEALWGRGLIDGQRQSIAIRVIRAVAPLISREKDREIERLKAELHKHVDMVCDQDVELSRLSALNGEMEKALEFYANESNWTDELQVNRDEMFDTPVQADGYGNRARAVLARLNRDAGTPEPKGNRK